jgi:hypothetical protein
MRRVDILGLTLAELSLVVLFAFLALALPSRSRLQRATARLSAENKHLSSEISTLQEQLSAERTARQALVAEIEKVGSTSKSTNLRSTAPPTCVEKGVATEWLATMVIRGRDQFEVNGRVIALNEVLEQFAPQLSAGRNAGCFHTARIFVGRNVSAADYDTALRRVEQHVYTRKFGLEP